MNPKIIYTLYLCLLFPIWLIGQISEDRIQDQLYKEEIINERPFDKEKWESITKGLDYSEKITDRKKKETIKTREGQEGTDFESQGRSPFSTKQGSGIMKFIIILLAVVVLVLLLRGLLGSDLKVKNKKIKKKGDLIDIHQIEEDIENADLQHFIQRALNDEQYALAVRLYYLSVLKELSFRKDIKWKKDKTNHDYLLEMRSSEHLDSFRTITYIFERVWYGEHPLDRNGYFQMEPGFKQFINQLKAEELV